MVRAFVTGATGFVGSAVVRCLLRRGSAVRVLARRSSDLSNIAGLEVEVAYGDLLDEDELLIALQGCDALFHVAALYSTAEADGPKMYEVNVHGTKAILRAAQRARVARVVHTSSIGTIGQPTDGSLATEATPLSQGETGSHYARSKYLGEVAALSMFEHGVPVVVVNPCAPVGARDIKPSSTGQRILDYLHGKLPSFVAGGINFVSVEDVAEGHVLAAEKGRVGQRYILGNRQGNLQMDDLLALMEQVTGVRRPAVARCAPLGLHLGLGRALRRRQQLPDAPLGGRRPTALTCDPSKAIRELGLPQTPLEVAFAEAVAWFREHGYV
jgi:dihydroflavonol-4-reductase